MFVIMKQRRFSKFFYCTLAVILLAVALPMMASAAIITVAAGSTSDSNPYLIGNWSIYNSYLVEYQPDETVAYLRFNASAGDRLAVVLSEKSDVSLRNNCTLTVYGPSGSTPYVVTNQIVYRNGNSLFPCYIARIDVNANGSYLIKIERSSRTDYYGNLTVSFEERIASASITVSVPGTATNPGNGGLLPQGVVSSAISVNLTNNSAIPNDAVVRTIKTSGTQTPSQGNVWHQLKPNISPTWFESTVSSNSSGLYSISSSNGFLVKQNWEFRYRAMATAASTMKNVSLIITYDYDQTLVKYI